MLGWEQPSLGQRIVLLAKTGAAIRRPVLELLSLNNHSANPSVLPAYAFAPARGQTHTAVAAGDKAIGLKHNKDQMIV